MQYMVCICAFCYIKEKYPNVWTFLRRENLFLGMENRRTRGTPFSFCPNVWTKSAMQVPVPSFHARTDRQTSVADNHSSSPVYTPNLLRYNSQYPRLLEYAAVPSY